jgi:glutamate synthase (NADPH/NADH) small chain
VLLGLQCTPIQSRLETISTTSDTHSEPVRFGDNLIVDNLSVPVEGTEQEIPAELVLLAMGFVGPEKDTVVSQLGVALDERGNIKRDNDYATDVEGVFVAGDAGRGQSLIVWAIAEGRACAAGVDEYLSGSTKLPKPIPPTARQMMV